MRRRRRGRLVVRYGRRRARDGPPSQAAAPATHALFAFSFLLVTSGAGGGGCCRGRGRLFPLLVFPGSFFWRLGYSRHEVEESFSIFEGGLGRDLRLVVVQSFPEMLDLLDDSVLRHCRVFATPRGRDLKRQNKKGQKTEGGRSGLRRGTYVCQTVDDPQIVDFLAGGVVLVSSPVPAIVLVEDRVLAVALVELL